MNKSENLSKTRRRFMKAFMGGAVAYKFNSGVIFAFAEEMTEFKILSDSDKFDIGNRGETMLKKAYDLGYSYEDVHRGCARCTVAALQDAIDFIPVDEALFRSSSCLDGGATPTKRASCGSFTGSGMVIGWVCGTNRFGDNRLSNKLIRAVYERFNEEYGSVICEDVRNKAGGKCPEVVGNSAKWTTEVLLRQFTNYK
jgi:hypothetical protein